MKFRIYILLSFLILSASLRATNIDSLLTQLEIVEEQDKIDILLELSKAHWTIAPSKGIYFADEAVKLCEKYNEEYKQAKAYLYGGVNAYYMGSYDDAIEYAQNSLSIAEKLQDKRLSSYSLNNLGMVHTSLNNYEIARENYTESLHLMEELNDEIEYAKILNNIAGINMLLGQVDLALEQNLSVLEIIEKSEEKVFLIWLYNDIGNIYKKKGDNTLALEYFHKALNTCNQIDNTLGRSQAMNNIGKVYLDEQDYEKAKKYFFSAIEYAREADAKESINEICSNISEYYAETGNYAKSLEYFKLHKQLSDSIINENKIRIIFETKARFDLESAENENRLLQKNIEIKELTIAKNTTQRNFLSISLSLTVLLIVLAAISLFLMRRKNRELNGKNSIINEQKDQLSEALVEQQKLNRTFLEQQIELLNTQKNLKKTNVTKDKFFSIIAHDLKGPISTILSFSTLILKKIDTLPTDDLVKFLHSIKTTSQSTYALLENLLTWARSQKGEISFEPEEVDLKEIIEESISIFELKASDKNIELINRCVDSYTCNCDRNMIKTIVTNLLNNATKYTRKNGKIEIDVQTIEKRLQVAVSDNGVGMKPEVKDNLFKIDKNQYSEEGTDGEKGTGLGLILCEEFIKKHGGKIWIESEYGKGSTVYFSIPL